MSRRTRKSRPAPQPTAPDHSRLQVAALVLVSVALFAVTLGFEFPYDDSIVIDRAMSEEFLQKQFTRGGLFSRWVRAASIWIDVALFGNDPIGYHVQSLLWHVGGVLLFYAFLLRLGATQGVAFLASLLFTVHPIHVEAIASIANRKELLCFVFSLASFFAYANFVERRRWPALAACGVLLYLAFFSKQVAAAMPIVFVAWELLFLPPERRFLMRRPGLVVGAGVPIAALFALLVISQLDLSNMRGIDTLSGFQGDASVGSIVAASARAFWRYLGLVLWPSGLCAEQLLTLDVPLAWTVFAWLGVALYAALALWLAFRVDALLGFGLLWFAIHYLPISNLIPSSYLLADRYMYIPSAGLCLAAVRGGQLLSERLSTRLGATRARELALAVAGLAVVALGLRTWVELPLWRNNDTLFEKVVVCCADCFRSQLGWGSTLVRRGEYARAVEHFDRAEALQPGLPSVHHARGSALAMLKRHRDALVDYEKATRLDPEHFEGWVNRGISHLAVDEAGEALYCFDQALARAPDNAWVIHDRGLALRDLGRREEAHQAFLQAVSRDPALVPAWLELGASHRMRGELDAARNALVRAAQLGSRAAQEMLRALGREAAGSDRRRQRERG